MDKRLMLTSISDIRKQIQDPTKGLPEEVFELVTTLTPMVNVDLLIRDDDGRILMAWRDDECTGKGWHIPGGIIRYKEKAEDRIQQTALKELGTEVLILKGPIEINEIIVPQEVRGHFISLLYVCKLPDGFVIPPEALGDETEPTAGVLKWHNKKPELVRGQDDIYKHIFTIIDI